MYEIKEISSLQNPLVKKVMLLKEKSRERKKSGCFVLEGKRELHLAIMGDYNIKTIFFYPGIISKDEILDISQRYINAHNLIGVSEKSIKNWPTGKPPKAFWPLPNQKHMTWSIWS